MRAAIYSRKSVKSETGDSIENQAALCRQYIEHHWPQAEIEVYEDEGFSGATLHRPQFAALMEAVQAGRVDMLVCYRLDRVSRSVTDFAALIETLNRRQVSFVCIREQFDTATPMGKAMLYIASVFAQLERETIAERVSDNMQLLARTGQWLGGKPPLGFCSVAASLQTPSGVKTIHRLRTVPNQAQAVKEAFAAFAKTGRAQAAQKALAQRGVEYTLAGVKSMLRNPVYCKADEQAYRYFAEQGAVLCFSPERATGAQGLMVYNKRQHRKKPGAWRPQAQWVVTLCEIAEALGERFVCSSWHSGGKDLPCLVASGMAGVMDALYQELDTLCRQRLSHITLADVAHKIFSGRAQQEPRA